MTTCPRRTTASSTSSPWPHCATFRSAQAPSARRRGRPGGGRAARPNLDKR
jgi:hypothetical protein